MEEPYFQILLNFTAYIQLMAAVDFGFLFMESRSLTVKFQRRLLEQQKESYKPVLDEAGSLTQRCQERWYGQDDEGRKILGLANRIRELKEVFMVDTELEKQSAFMPALGLSSGLFCLFYLIAVPFLISSGNLNWLYWLEYVGEAILLGHLVVILTFVCLPAYRAYLTSLAMCVGWIFIGLLLALLFFSFSKNLIVGEFWLYELMFIAIPAVPVVFMIGRLVSMLIDRKRRINSISKLNEDLQKFLNTYRIKR